MSLKCLLKMSTYVFEIRRRKSVVLMSEDRLFPQLVVSVTKGRHTVKWKMIFFFPFLILLEKKQQQNKQEKGEEARAKTNRLPEDRTNDDNIDGSETSNASIQDIRKRCESLDVLPSKQLSTLFTTQSTPKSSLLSTQNKGKNSCCFVSTGAKHGRLPNFFGLPTLS